MRALLSIMTVLALGLGGGPAEAATPHKKKPHTAAHSTASHKIRSQKGRISYYHPKLKGKKMANGERFSPASDAAASKTLPLGSKATVTNLENGKSETVEVKDRGPAVPGRIMDVSPATADKLGMKKDGAVKAEVTPIAPAPSNN